MTPFIASIVSAVTIGACASIIVIVFVRVLTMVSDRGRDNLDPPPAIFSPFMPLIKFVAFYGTSNMSDERLDKIDEALALHGVSFTVTAEEFIAGQIVLSVVGASAILILGLSSGDINLALLILFSVVAWFLPNLWMKDFKRRRDTEVMRTLPIYLEYLTMCVDAGLDLPGAMKQAVDKGPRGAMRNEFRVILRDISSGYTRADALARFDERMSLPEVTSLVSAVTQANKMGSSLFDTLQSQAEQRLDERFRRAEKMAMEAPVKLIVPLVIFIFPLTFIILLFPIVTRFYDGGSL
ncbi:type II secretion system F family protein [Luminiphilus sp.]|nr:type II secretion system F family protein [Luminiphilus sp.]MDA9710800.1 type II secretion system F family protein [Luminiphilus sp.]